MEETKNPLQRVAVGDRFTHISQTHASKIRVLGLRIVTETPGGEVQFGTIASKVPSTMDGTDSATRALSHRVPIVPLGKGGGRGTIKNNCVVFS